MRYSTMRYSKMQLKKTVLCISILVAGTISAQNVYDVYPERVESQKSKVESQKSKVESQTNGEGEKGRDGEKAKGREGEETKRRKGNGVFTGFTGGMKLHAGYAFANSPDELFHNGSLEDMSNLPKDGVTMGLGGELRLHFINHVHLGAEGGMSAMPLMKSGSLIRNGWGGVLCDFYGQVGKAQLFIGGIIGGGSSKRLYVPSEETMVSDVDNVVYNASYTKTSYFLLDPYVGIEFTLTKRMSLMIEIDYMLPFGDGGKGLNTETVRWSNFLSPSGPRLYVGLLFGRHDQGHQRR